MQTIYKKETNSFSTGYKKQGNKEKDFGMREHYKDST